MLKIIYRCIQFYWPPLFHFSCCHDGHSRGGRALNSFGLLDKNKVLYRKPRSRDLLSRSSLGWVPDELLVGIVVLVN